MATKDYSFLSGLIRYLDKRHYNYVNSLTEEQLKEVTPFTLLRWFSTVPDASGLSIYQIIVSQELNKKYNCLNKKLLLQNMCSSGNGRELRHQWISPVLKSKIKKKSKKWEKVKELLELNDIETDIIFKDYTDSQINDLLHLFGIQDSDIKKL